MPTSVRKNIDRLCRLHAEAYQRHAADVRPLPGARELLRYLAEAGVPHVIATSGGMETAAINIAALGIDPVRVPAVTRDQVKYAKPDPDLFITAAARLNVPIESSLVIGDAIWDMPAARRARAFGVGLLSGGCGQEENWNAPVRPASMRILPICCATLMKSASAVE